ncbi:NAD-glutamate dehydrogenase [Altererythrobacter aquiaggeris]|uniref:NAD-glutamate dehydrogenase n=1 Tax=Aestuarierythrobacter aquiaggeris TaxID=1898396 RepID=UPI003AFADDA9
MVGMGKQKSAKLVAALAAQIRDSLLPGDAPFVPAELDGAATLLLETANARKAGSSSITINTGTVADARRIMRIAIVNDDMPFLVDSIAATIAALGLTIDRLVHPVVSVHRDKKNRLERISADGDIARESMIYLETGRIDARQRSALKKALDTTLSDVHAAVGDWPKLQEAMRADADSLGDTAGAQLLRWLNAGMLTQLGHLTRKRDGSHSGLLGICRRTSQGLLADSSFENAFKYFDDAPEFGRGKAPLIIKANRVANVHRRVPLDLFVVPLVEDGKLTALSIHAGVWTSAALAAPPRDIPVMRESLETLMERFGFIPGGHAAKSLIHALTTLPHDLAIGFSEADLELVSSALMSLVDRPRPRLALVEAPLARHMFAFVWLPRDMLSTQVRLQIRDLLIEHTGAELLDWSLQVEGGTLATLRFVLDIRGTKGLPDQAALDAQLQTLLRGWGDAVEAELAEGVEPGRAAAIAGRYADAFPAAYRADYGAAEAALDIRRLRALSTDSAATGTLRDARLYRFSGDAENRLRLKIYQQTGSISLSDTVPALENFGFHVLTEVPTMLQGGDLGSVHDFTLALAEGVDVGPLLDRADAIEHAIANVLNGIAEDDPFNRLVVGTGLTSLEANGLRAFYRYLRQTGMGFTIYTVVDALRQAPSVTRGILDFFIARHDPDFSGNREDAAQTARDAIRKGLAKVSAINDDRLLRLYQAVAEAILRTNAFAPAAREALAFKIDSSLVPNLPKPVPWREIWVYSRRVEGIHLRAGPVARGGLRWSDRRDDFRTEILGLMKAQRVKNAVIVPTGAKGGFYPKQLPDAATDREGWAAEGRASYELFIRTLLSVTDDYNGDKLVHPDRVVIHDGPDPYFVVAADKGTASFSDVANAIAEKNDFWLGDAFASGGSNGYDHKAMGITARGAWVSVQRHFLEMGVDVQHEPVQVVGCGDMSGDVFGNGMLLSKALKLVAAFDHRHIFIDPDPDPAASWKERKRLFQLARSSWEDYDQDLISRGGGVYSRASKTIKLSVAAQTALGLDQQEMDPETLISGILTAPVDLIWFGGIGTYIKAGSENNIQVGDPGNDRLRVDANQLRARVIGEGANLGVTQAGRIEFALGGGRLNTDFIDNSAGVDCSDNEVNIKIALRTASQSGKLSEAKRSSLLASMTEEVAEIVLEDNRLQALALSVAQVGGAKATESHLRLIEKLEDGGNLDRKTEGLADSETLSRRAADGLGLTRPELAVLLSSTKLALQAAIEASDLPDDPGMIEILTGYFPQPMRGKYRKAIEEHRLRREIIATILANQIVNRMGVVHPFELAEEEGTGLAQVASAFVAAERLFGFAETWTKLDEANISETARLKLFDRYSAGMANQAADLLRVGAGDVQPSDTVSRLAKGVTALSSLTQSHLADESKEQSAKLRHELVAAGAGETEAAMVTHLFDMDGAVGIANLAKDAEIDPRKLTAAFTELGAKLGLAWAQGTAAMMNSSDVWERMLVSGLARDFQQMRLDFLRRMSRRKDGKSDPASTVEQWAESNADAIAQFRKMVARAQAQSSVAPAMLAQIASQARNLLGR